MHSLESLRDIRAMESIFGTGNEKHLDPRRQYKQPPNYKSKWEVSAVLRYNLETREIRITPVIPA